MKELLERKADIKAAIKKVSDELAPHLVATENLRFRLSGLHDDLSTVLNAITEARLSQERQEREEITKRKKVR